MGVSGLWKLLKTMDCVQHMDGREAAEWLEGKRLAVDLGSILIPGLLSNQQNRNPASATKANRSVVGSDLTTYFTVSKPPQVRMSGSTRGNVRK
jgi:hypothetical protein